jgi:hypothetical protein
VTPPPAAPSPPAPPPSTGEGIDLQLPDSANGRGFAAFIDFTVFGGAGGPRGATTSSLARFLFGTPTPARARKGRSGAGSLVSSEQPTHGTLGAAKTLVPKRADTGSSLWWAYVVLAALIAVLALFSALAFVRRRRLNVAQPS